jgi:hypothetical protein
MNESRYAISRLNLSRLSIETRGERSHRVGDQRLASLENLCVETSKTSKSRQRFGSGHIRGGRMDYSIVGRANPCTRSSENR